MIVCFTLMESVQVFFLLFVYICNDVGDQIIKKREGWNQLVQPRQICVLVPNQDIHSHRHISGVVSLLLQ
jgi:hypothetical protein